MKTRWGTCVFILLLMLMGASFPIAAGQPAAAAQATDGHGITGEWQGIVAGQHLIVRVAQVADASFTAALTVVDQGNATLPLDAVSFGPNGAFRFELKSDGVVYEAKLSHDGSELVGTWHQGGNSISLSLHRPGAAPAKFTLKPKTLGSIPLEPCRSSDGNTEGLCGKFEVYEDRHSRGRKIALNIMVLPALSDKPAGSSGRIRTCGQNKLHAHPFGEERVDVGFEDH